MTSPSREQVARTVSGAMSDYLGQQPGAPLGEDYAVADAILALFHATPPTPAVSAEHRIIQVGHRSGGDRSGNYVVCACSGATSSTDSSSVYMWADDYPAHLLAAAGLVAEGGEDGE